jgi:hypothetical protein
LRGLSPSAHDFVPELALERQVVSILLQVETRGLDGFERALMTGGATAGIASESCGRLSAAIAHPSPGGSLAGANQIVAKTDARAPVDAQANAARAVAHAFSSTLHTS